MNITRLQHQTEALNLLRHACKLALNGTVLNGRTTVRFMLLDCLLQAAARPERLEGCNPNHWVPRFNEPMHSHALGAVCRALPRAANPGSMAARLHKILAWCQNAYVNQHHTIRVLEDAVHIATHDLHALKERIRLTKTPKARPRLQRWQPKTAAHRSSFDETTPSCQTVPKTALLAAMPHGIAARQQDLATVIHRNRLQVFEPLSALKGISAYDDLVHITRVDTVVFDLGHTNPILIDHYLTHNKRNPQEAADVVYVDQLGVLLTTDQNTTHLFELPYGLPLNAIYKPLADRSRNQSPFKDTPRPLIMSRRLPFNPTELLAYIVASTFDFHPDQARQHHDQLKDLYTKQTQHWIDNTLVPPNT